MAVHVKQFVHQQAEGDFGAFNAEIEVGEEVLITCLMLSGIEAADRAALQGEIRWLLAANEKGETDASVQLRLRRVDYAPGADVPLVPTGVVVASTVDTRNFAARSRNQNGGELDIRSFTSSIEWVDTAIPTQYALYQFTLETIAVSSGDAVSLPSADDDRGHIILSGTLYGPNT